MATASKVPIAAYETSADEHFTDFGELSVFTLVDVILNWLLPCSEPCSHGVDIAFLIASLRDLLSSSGQYSRLYSNHQD